MADILSCGGRWGYGEQEDHGEKGGKSDYHIKIALERLLEVEEQLDKRAITVYYNIQALWNFTDHSGTVNRVATDNKISDLLHPHDSPVMVKEINLSCEMIPDYQ
ncbi:hypothetical protein JHK82_050240 [Glycine max]|nr:hypothetical protein JHK82_050240 [Glycine max]